MRYKCLVSIRLLTSLHIRFQCPRWTTSDILILPCSGNRIPFPTGIFSSRLGKVIPNAININPAHCHLPGLWIQVFYAFVLILNISSNTLPSQGPKSMPRIAAIVGAISTIWISPNWYSSLIQFPDTTKPHRYSGFSGEYP